MRLLGRRVTLHHVSGKTRIDVEFSSIDLAVSVGGRDVLLTNYLTRLSPLSWTMTPTESRQYAARLLKAADQAEKESP